ncbi:MAG: aspartyl-tRNA(Asn)/glutamyl-tRNA(Gln) amidotransferase subunit C [Candidatus Tokpelaia sp. JSC085]|nr:MAG: aspartyl-tRNA(Asn)/glutamyl-tRNA(Gln) amidotransferase subunit C [Candidatus Tokpelaia sp. JSC085]
MSVDLKTVKHMAHLARITLEEKEAQRMGDEINALLKFVEQLNKVDVTGIEPTIAVIPFMTLRTREDLVQDGRKPQDILANAPVTADSFFLVPKVVE